MTTDKLTHNGAVDGGTYHLRKAATLLTDRRPEFEPLNIARAQVHATLALALFTASAGIPVNVTESAQYQDDDDALGQIARNARLQAEHAVDVQRFRETAYVQSGRAWYPTPEQAETALAVMRLEAQR